MKTIDECKFQTLFYLTEACLEVANNHEKLSISERFGMGQDQFVSETLPFGLVLYEEIIFGLKHFDQDFPGVVDYEISNDFAGQVLGYYWVATEGCPDLARWRGFCRKTLELWCQRRRRFIVNIHTVKKIIDEGIITTNYCGQTADVDWPEDHPFEPVPESTEAEDFRFYQQASRSFLGKALPDDYSSLSPDEQDDFLRANAWAPLETWAPSDIWGVIENAASELKTFVDTL